MPNRIDELFFEVHRVDRATLENLDYEEVDELRRIAMERRDNPNRVRALGFLASFDPGTATEAVTRIVTDAEESADMRASAAAIAARLGRDIESALIDAIRFARESFVRRRIAATLGEVGGPAAADALQGLVNDDDASVRTQAEFSLSVLAAREGVDGFDLPQPSREEILEPHPGAAQPFSLDRASLNEATHALQSLERRSWGVAVARDSIFSVSCERDQMMIALDDRMNGPEAIDRLAERPSLPALVLSRAPDDGSWSVRWLVLTWPHDRERFHVAVHRTGGQQVLFGEMVVEGRGLGFILESLRGPGQLAIRLSGRLADGRIEVREAVASRSREPSNMPRPFHLPGLTGGPDPEGESPATDTSPDFLSS